jgi:hypothetical protein
VHPTGPLGGLVHTDCADLKINIVDPQSKQFPAAKTRRRCQNKERRVLFPSAAIQSGKLTNVLGYPAGFAPRKENRLASPYHHPILVRLRYCEVLERKRRRFLQVAGQNPRKPLFPFLPSPFVHCVDVDVFYRNIVPIRLKVHSDVCVCHIERGYLEHVWRELLSVEFDCIGEVTGDVDLYLQAVLMSC